MEYTKICKTCLNEFIAHKATTNYCSASCARKAYKQRMREERAQTVSDETEDQRRSARTARFKSLRVMKPSQAAEYIGVPRTTMFRYLRDGVVPCARPAGEALIRKSDLDLLFEVRSVVVKSCNATRLSFDDFMTVTEVAGAASVCRHTAEKMLHGLRHTVFGGVIYYRREEVETMLRRREKERHPEIDAWYTKSEIMSEYGMTESAVYSMASEHGIPRKRCGNATYYSKEHVDAIRGGLDKLQEEYNSREEAMAKYHFTYDQLKGMVRRHGIRTMLVGHRSWVNKSLTWTP